MPSKCAMRSCRHANDSIGARVAAGADPGEILATGTVKDLVAGSDFLFHSLGARQLTGIPGTWPVFTITA